MHVYVVQLHIINYYNYVRGSIYCVSCTYVQGYIVHVTVILIKLIFLMLRIVRIAEDGDIGRGELSSARQTEHRRGP